MPSSICFLQKQTAFEFLAKTTGEPWISLQGNHLGSNVLNIINLQPLKRKSSKLWLLTFMFQCGI